MRGDRPDAHAVSRRLRSTVVKVTPPPLRIRESFAGPPAYNPQEDTMKFIPVAIIAALAGFAQDAPKKEEAPLPEDSLYRLKTKTLEGKDADLGDYRGKVTLVVNVASACGFTPQYTGL